MLSALHLLQRKVGFVLGGVFRTENMSAAFLLLLSCLQDFFVFQAVGFTFDLLDSSNYMINSLHPVVVWELDLTVALGSGLFVKVVTAQGEGLQRWRQLQRNTEHPIWSDIYMKLRQTFDMRWPLQHGDCKPFSSSHKFLFAIEKLLGEINWIRDVNFLSR